MEYARRAWAQIRVYLGHLTFAERAVIALVAVVLVLALVLLLHYAGRSEMETITAFVGDRQAEVVEKLKARGIRVETEGGQIRVESARFSDALAVLNEGDLLTSNTAKAFDEMLTRSTPWQTNADKSQAFLLAKQKVLGQVIAKMAEVRSADVMLSMPEDRSFGRNAVRPSASVTVVMQSDRPMTRKLADAVAGLVSGAVAEMKLADVEVIDARTGKRHKPGDDAAGAVDEMTERRLALENQKAKDLGELLAYIPRCIVKVSVVTDQVRARTVERTSYEKSEPLRREHELEMERRDTGNAGEAGVRPNTELAITGGGAVGTMERTTERTTEFGDKPVTERSHVVEAGQAIRQINVSVAVPRTYFVNLFKRSKGAAGPEPDDNALAPLVSEEMKAIEATVTPHLAAGEGGLPGLVRVRMYDDSQTALTTTAAAGAAGLGGMLESQWTKPVGLSVLALVSVGLMLGMVRKATRRPPLPSAQDLAGVPPTLPSEDDLVGEAGESDPSMAGVELDEDELRTRKIAQQISDMIKSNPGEAAHLVRRWVRTEE